MFISLVCSDNFMFLC